MEDEIRSAVEENPAEPPADSAPVEIAEPWTKEKAELEDLTEPEAGEIWQTVTDGVRALKAAYRPDALNVGINLGAAAGGSVARHLHVHIVPRWNGDANFMTATAYTRTMPEALPDTWAKVRSAWTSP